MEIFSSLRYDLNAQGVVFQIQFLEESDGAVESVEEDGPRRRIGGRTMKLRKGNKQWTKNQIEDALDDVRHDIHSQERHIGIAQEKIETLEILQRALRDMLKKYFKNPSSRKFNEDVPVSC